MTREERLKADGYEGVEPVEFYSARDEYGAFSNFSPHPVVMINPWTGRYQRYSTIEHRFQAMKATNLRDHGWVVEAPSSGDAKLRGGPGGISLREGWGSSYGDLCWYVMHEAVLAKAMQHPKIAELLLSTGDRPIWEDSPVDDIWGIRYEQSYTGKNLLGECWMDVRNLLEELA